jgi:hypothetical protein
LPLTQEIQRLEKTAGYETLLDNGHSLVSAFILRDCNFGVVSVLEGGFGIDIDGANVEGADKLIKIGLGAVEFTSTITPSYFVKGLKFGGNTTFNLTKKVTQFGFKLSNKGAILFSKVTDEAISNAIKLGDEGDDLIDFAFAKLENALGLNPQPRLAGVNGESIPITFNMAEKPVKNIKPVVSGSGGTPKWFPYKKHIPKSWMTTDDILKATKEGDSLYLAEINVEKLELEAWEKGLNVTNGKPYKVIEFDKPIGANKGKLTNYMRIEMTSGNIIHGHPISFEDYQYYLKVK